MTKCLYCSRTFHGAVALGLGPCRRCVVVRAGQQAMADETTWESLAKKPGGDHDVAFAFGNPRAGLTTRDMVGLLYMRGQVKDQRGPIVGDSDYRLEPQPSGLWLAKYWGDVEA